MIEDRIVQVCAFSGAAVMFALNFLFGASNGFYGGAIGGAIGGGLGAAAGLGINKLRKRSTDQSPMTKS